ncbi:adenylate/guanylate cyclase domain-containing protein [uncultured Alsobacter sp.]|uniref:adenylate/guanylate cyclase domain-containing protein n=1 Tax=uncultured Alsobacter sp. TaxID=1748258 RepID=UPI0025E27F76|nr:adenylate/guanylate cyclase domain-containing protein [uncultured Alsobacter sp.]
MTPDQETALRDWLLRKGLYGLSEEMLLQGFATRCVEAGLALSRTLVLIDTLHPVLEGRAYAWRDEGDPVRVSEYGRTAEREGGHEAWEQSPFNVLMQRGGGVWRLRIGAGEGHEFPMVAELAGQGHTDYIAVVHRYADDAVMGEMESLFSHFVSRRPGGFTDAEEAALHRLVPALLLAMKSAALARVPRTLASVYLGRDPAERVLAGRIERGVADRIPAVLWFSDLRAYSTLSDTAGPGEILPLLNDYAEATVGVIHAQGGDVLKLIGDGVLAMFPVPDAGDGAGPAWGPAARAALGAVSRLRRRLRALNAERSAAGRPVTTAYVALHAGEVFYGNIGSRDRLDFTVIGPAVNEVARIAGLCRSVDRDLLLSAAIHDALDPAIRDDLVSVGRYALRGMGEAQHLFTPDPGIARDEARKLAWWRKLGVDGEAVEEGG